MKQNPDMVGSGGRGSTQSRGRGGKRQFQKRR